MCRKQKFPFSRRKKHHPGDNQATHAPRHGPNRTAARAIREGRTAHIDRPYGTGRPGAAARALPHPGRGTRKPIRATAAAVSLVARQPPAARLHTGLAHRVDKQAASSLPTGNRTGNDRQRQDGQGRHMVTTRDRREYGRYSSAKCNRYLYILLHLALYRKTDKP